MANSAFVAIDLGAESGRTILARIDDSRLQLEEVNRFSNGPIRIGDALYWDALRLFEAMKQGLAAVVRDRQVAPAGIGLDTWGVDFGLLGAGDELLGNPRHYRDPRTNGIMDKAFARVTREQMFERTGIQFMQFNSVFQLFAMRLAGSPLLDIAKTFLTMPDLFNFWLAGEKVCEFSNATTTQLYDPRAKTWAVTLFEALRLPLEMMPKIVPPGTVIGALRPSICEELGTKAIPVIAPACHDTGSAVAAVPAEPGSNWAFLSSGTWSLMGMEVPAPIITSQSQAYNFTNEGGVGNTFRFLKNIMGLWLVQECRRTWQRAGQAYDYGQLSDLAAASKPFAHWVNVDDPSFLAPGDMPARIAAFCERTGQAAPDSPGAFVRCCLESLALTYRVVVNVLEECTGRKIDVIHAVGGGIQNTLLCQMAADATGRTVVTGPIEATAAGNVVMQAIAAGALKNIDEARDLVRRSFELKTYAPKPSPAWDEAYARLCKHRSET
ncbi:MAG: rhamnulokinase [Phycisphaerae bacterium]|nr:rhamnulokinase [Phycisphaerae bacterium]